MSCYCFYTSWVEIVLFLLAKNANLKLLILFWNKKKHGYLHVYKVIFLIDDALKEFFFWD